MDTACNGKASRRWRAVAGVVGGLLTAPSVTFACPMCARAIEGDPVAIAFNWTTLFMIAVPMSLFAMIAGWVFYAYWRAARPAAPTRVRRLVWAPAWTGKENDK